MEGARRAALARAMGDELEDPQALAARMASERSPFAEPRGRKGAAGGDEPTRERRTVAAALSVSREILVSEAPRLRRSEEVAITRAPMSPDPVTAEPWVKRPEPRAWGGVEAAAGADEASAAAQDV